MAFNMSTKRIVKVKKCRKNISLDTKLKVLNRFETGEKASAIAKALGLAISTVCTIRENSIKILSSAQAVTPGRATNLFRNRSDLMENMEQHLNDWIESQIQNDIPVNTLVIREKAKTLFERLKRESGQIYENESFNASRGWYERFKNRSNLLNNKMGDESENDIRTAEEYPTILQRIIKEGGYTPQQVFNVDETGLYWKRMPGKIFQNDDEGTSLGSKDRLTLLFGCNAEGDFKLKPLLVYYSETPRAMKGYSKPDLPVIWRSNKNSFICVSIFQEWFSTYFCPAVEKYCYLNNLPYRALLIIDKGLGHPVNLNDISQHVRVEFLPKNRTSSIQPMCQGVVSTFKACYLRRAFAQFVQLTENTGAPIKKELWRNYHIMNAIDNISESWEELPLSAMNQAWEKLWPECVHESVSIQETVSDIQKNIIDIAKHVGFDELDESDVVEFIQSHSEDFFKENISQDEKFESEEDSESTESIYNPRQLTMDCLYKSFTHLEAALKIISENDPCRDRSLKVTRAVNEAFHCYKELYREKQKRFLQNSVNQVSASTSKSKITQKKIPLVAKIRPSQTITDNLIDNIANAT